MADYSTPKSALSEISTVFMTPSSSVGRPIYSRQPKILTPLPHLSFLSPAPSPAAMSKISIADSEHKDIITELLRRGIPCLVDEILSMLPPADLYSCLQVSHQWYDIIAEKPHRIEQIRSHNLKASTENLKKPSLPFNSCAGTRRALSTLSNTLPPHPLLHHQTLHSIYKAVQTQKHHPCPTCGSPARQLNLRRTVCINVSCQMDFCQKCFRLWHEGECKEQSSLSRSPKRGNSTLLAGSTKSKKRLRRL